MGRTAAGRALDLVVLVIACGGAALASLAMGVDRNWDLMNYHLYAPLAFFNGRILTDVAAGLMQGYFNPTNDFLTLFLFRTLNDQPMVITAVYGALHGLNFFLVFKIAGVAFAGRAGFERVVAAGFAATVGATGAVVVSILGTTTNDLLTSIPCLLAVYLLMRYLQAEATGASRRRFALLAGVALGVACGLKYTMGLYALALGLAYLAMVRDRRAFVDVLLFCLVAAGTLAATAGYHAVFMAEHFDNPIFPNLNNLFRSPYLAPSNFRDMRFLPDSVIGALAYPLHWAAGPTSVSSEVPFRDARFALAAFAVAVFLASAVIRVMLPASLAGGEPEHRTVPRTMHFLVLFWAAGFVLWVAIFGISRYLVTADLLSGVILAFALLLFLRSLPIVLAAMAAVLALLAVTTVHFSWGREPHGDRFIDARFPDIPAGSSIFFPGDLPLGFLAAFLPDESRIYRVGSYVFVNDSTSILARRVATALADDKRPRYLIIYSADPAKKARPPELPREYSMVETQCRQVVNNMGYYSTRLWLCPIVNADPPR